ncbi:MAG: HlyD family efflux transporter periplasmic adaptor subunit, partial [Pseudomonadota bacterium]
MTSMRNLALFALPLGAAVAVFLMAAEGGRAPARVSTGDAGTPVRVLTVREHAVTPTIVGHATVQPEVTWRAVAKVAGTVTELDARLRQGAILPAGTLLAEIDPADYRTELQRAEAALASARAELMEAEADRAKTAAMLELERKALDLQQADTERQRALIRSGTTARTTLNASERTLLAQQLKVQDLAGQLDGLPARLDRLAAQVAMAEADVARAEQDLARTRIEVPFDAQVASVEVEEGEYVTANTSLATLDGIERVEIVARLREGAFEQFAQLAGLDDRVEMLAGLTAEVVARAGGGEFVWPAEVLHMTDGVAGDSRTIGVVLSVVDPLGQTSTRRPPLRKGSFVTVRLSAAPIEGRLAVPLSALRNGRVYIADAGDRLRIV